MDDLNEKRERLQTIAKSIVRIGQWSSSTKGKLSHAGGRTCALSELNTSELLKFLDKAEDLITVTAITQFPANCFTVIFRI